jgi:MFS family permease
MGYVVGAIVCGHLTDAIGYAGTFLVNALILLVALLLVAVAYHPKAIEDEEALPEVFLASTRAANGTSHAEEEKALLSLSTRLSQRRLVHRCSDSY